MNEGKMMAPHVVKTTESSVWAQPFSKDVANEIKEDLIQVISDQNGTGHSFYNKNVVLAGKTGTGEIKDSQDDTEGTEVGWFTAVSYTHLDVYKRQAKDGIMDRTKEIEQSIIKKYRKQIWRKFVKGIQTYDMIQPNDKIAVCISGCLLYTSRCV